MKYRRCEVCGVYLEGPKATGEIKDSRCSVCDSVLSKSAGELLAEEALQDPAEEGGVYKRTGFSRGRVPNLMSIKDSGSIILIVIASVAVQRERLFVDVKGYSARGVTWTLDFFDIEGHTADIGGPWLELENYIADKRFVGDDGHVYKINFTIVDCGWNTEYVYAFASRYSSGLYACKGVDYLHGGETYKLFDKAIRNHIGLERAFHINTGKMKDRISNILSALVWKTDELQPPWYANFPEDFRNDYFKAPNHAFNTYSHNLAMLEICADNYCRTILLLPNLDWEAFWQAIKESPFFDKSGTEK